MKYKILIISLTLLSCKVCLSQNTNQSETVYLNAAFEEVAPCPCDLTQGACDLNCCCDLECTAGERNSFSSCIPFLPGGQDAEIQQYRCSSKHFAKEDWFPLLCVHFEYNAFLGYFYEWQYKLANSLQTFLSRLRTTYFYWYREEETRTITDSNNTGYVYGISLKTQRPSDNTTRERFGFLTIPQPTLSGSCLYTAPVRYLTNIDTSCTYQMTDSLCSSASVLSQLYYTQASSITGTTTRFFSVLELESSTNNQIVDTTVTYKCADNTFMNTYLKSTQVLSDLVNPSQSYLFNYDLPTDPDCVDSCGIDTCIDLNNLTNPDPTTAPTVIADCPSQIPAGPTLVVGVCQNAVLDVDYRIKWAGKSIASVEATIIVGNIPILNAAGTANELTQKYKVTFESNVTEVGEGSTDNFNNITDGTYERSGRVGYNISKPLHSGSMVLNSSVTPPEFMYVNTNSTRQMAVFDTSAAGLCFNHGRRTIMFGEDISTSCKLMLNISDFSDCSGLRKLIFNRLNALMPSDVLGRRGNNDALNSGYWIGVLRPDNTDNCSLADYFPLGLSPVDNRTGICYNMTTGIHLDVLYGITGRSDGFPIYEVLGSKISYTKSTWSASCSSLSGGVCRGTRTQPFHIYSSVKFTEVPPQTPEPKAKYYETPEEDDKELCPGDRCWDNLFYPFTHRYMSDSREYVFGMVSLTIIFFVGYGLVTRPWW